jgi:hypothetical protein
MPALVQKLSATLSPLERMQVAVRVRVALLSHPLDQDP